MLLSNVSEANLNACIGLLLLIPGVAKSDLLSFVSWTAVLQNLGLTSAASNSTWLTNAHAL